MGNVLAYSSLSRNVEKPTLSKASTNFTGNEFSTIEWTIPSEVTSEILSWLPIKCLLALQLVCKEWQALIRDFYFIKVHASRATSSCWRWHYAVDALYATSTGKFHFICGGYGLILVRSNESHKYFIWNPAIRKILVLPDPRKNSFDISLTCIPSTGSYKLVSIYHDEEHNGHGWEVLTIGHQTMWRDLTVPDSSTRGCCNSGEKVPFSVVSVGMVVYCIWKTDNYLAKIVCLDVETERFNIASVSTRHAISNWDLAWALNWNGKVTFAEEVGGNLHMMVLEGCKKLEWGREKRTIALAALGKDAKNGCIRVFGECCGCWFWWKNKDMLACVAESGYVSGAIRARGGLKVSNKVYTFYPSLVSFEGMQPDSKLQNLRRQLPL